MKFVMLAALVLPMSRAFFFHHPIIHGNSYRYRGNESVLDHVEDLFQPGDTFIDVTLERWDLSNVASLNLPQSLQKLSLINCKLTVIPEEVRALKSLHELNLAENQLKSFDGMLMASAALVVLNASHNNLVSYNVSLPHLTALSDLSANALEVFPNAVCASPQLESFQIFGNGFEIAAVSIAQYDLFAGLSSFQAAFADVSSCTSGSLVYLQGKGVCRFDDDAADDPAIIVRDHGTDKAEEVLTPMATEGAVSPYLPVPGNTAKKYIIAAVIVLVVVGIIACVITLISLGVVGGIARAVYDYISRWQMKRHREGIHEDTPLFFDQTARAGYQKEMEAIDKLFPSNDRVLVTWRIDYDSVTLVKKIAQGAFGEVWAGRYRKEQVAVKRLMQEQVSLVTSEAFLREIKLMAWLEHPKIIQFVGVAWTKLVDMLAVIEYMDGGDLRTLLDQKQPKQLSWQEGSKLQYARDTIDAIVYLHSLSPVIVHRDLKSRNILLDSQKGAKLGDFGVSATKRSEDMTTGVGTTRWIAPEIARGEEKYTEAVDVYSFGIILAELDTHQLPFADAKNRGMNAPLNDMAILQGVSTGELQVTMSASCPHNLQDLARKCMSLDPLQRPTAAQVAYEIRKADLLL